MDLETFRAIDVDIDLANDFVPDVMLSANDYNGRCIVARVTNGGVSVNGDNLSARLLFNTAPGISPGGYVTMTRVASSPTATWQVPVPSDALVARQVMLCVQIVDSDDNLVCSRNFRGIVDRKLMDDGAPESVNELNRLWEGIDALENIDASVAADGTVSVTAPDGTVTTSTAVPTAVSAANSATSAANTAATAANTAATAASTATDDANAAAARAEEAARPTEEMFASYHALLRAGASEGIASDANPVQSSFLNRASGSAEGVRDGIATIECVRGNTVGWNQLISLTEATGSKDGVSFATHTDGTIVINGTNEGSATVQFQLSATQQTIDPSHKYLMRGCPAGGTPSTYSMSNAYTTVAASYDYGNGCIFSYDALSNFMIRINIMAGYTANNLVYRPQLFDLTAMFGAGNEPATVEEFEELYPLPYYAYDPGTLKPAMFEGMKTIGFNAYDPDSGTADVITGNVYQIIGTYTSVAYSDGTAITPDSSGYFTPDRIDSIVVTGGNSTDTCIHLKWSGYRDGEYEEYWRQQREIDVAQYFPTGMKAAGSVADALYKDHADHVVGSVDLGTLTWYKARGTDFSYFYAQVPTPQITGTGGINAKCVKYESRTSWYFDRTDKSLLMAYKMMNNSVNIRDSDFEEATVADFKAAMSGVMLYYELANSAKTTEVIDPPLNLGYKVSDFGTERVMLADGVISAPPVFEIAYGYNAETLRDAAASIVAPVENHLAQDNYAIGSYLVRDGVLYKVTAAIARNETIVPGTNVTATTVMAEIAAISV